MHRRHEPDLECPGGVPGLAEETRHHRLLTAHRPREEPGVSTARMEVQLGKAGVEARAGSGEPHVTGERQVEARTDRRTIHRGNCRQGAGEDPEEASVDLLHVLELAPGRGAQYLELRAGAECRARAGEHETAHGGIPLTRIERLDDGLHQRGR